MTESQKHLYLIEDDRMSERLKKLLETKGGYKVTLFEKVDDALAKLATDPWPDAIVTDHNTPGRFKGADLVEAMKNDPIGIVLYSATDRNAEIDAALKANPNATYLLKSATDPVKVLLPTIHDAVANTLPKHPTPIIDERVLEAQPVQSRAV